MKTKSLPLVIAGLICLSAISHAQINMYGLTSLGGDSGVGTVFSITSSGGFNVIASLHNLYAAEPQGSLLYASDGNFYATSMDGGYQDSCTVFRCSPNGTLYTEINLDSVWGSSMPLGNSLIQAKDGNLYGMTTYGGDSSLGVLFKLKLSGQYSALHFFYNSTGYSPIGSLIQTSDGNLWGMTSAGGTYGAGTIFKCTTSGLFTSVFSFDSLDGTIPYGDLLMANDGNFYGLTTAGGKYGYGTIFKYDPTSSVFTKLIDFNDSNGATPYGSLIQANDGNLYGMTYAGGDSGIGLGTIFKYTLSGTLKTLVEFNGPNGAYPMGSLMQATDGNLYGMTSGGGTNAIGNIFKYTLSGNLTTLFSFNFGSSGYDPMYGALIEVDSNKEAGVPAISKINSGVIVYPNPSNGQFTIQGNNTQDNAEFISVYNLMGEKIISRELTDKTNMIDLSSHSAGVYLYRVVDEDGNLIGTGKLIIQK